jgi:gamma-glutamylcyclotransferase (GGCT)/AIG2-like uncharacterized protein YtfP
MNTHLVFVYGTLRSGSPGAMTIRFPAARFLSDASVSGRLYDLGTYPGLLTSESSSLVKGEIYQVDDDTLRELDEFEASGNYRRKQVEVFVATGKTTCWAYEPDPDLVTKRDLITSGDWIEHAKTRT